MKKTLVVFFTFLLNVTLNAFSAPQEDLRITIVESGDDKEIPDKGLRIPSAQATCVIDFSNLSIITERVPMIVYYELWDESGSIAEVEYDTDYELVAFLSSLSGRHQLRLVTAESTYIGYVDL